MVSGSAMMIPSRIMSAVSASASASASAGRGMLMRRCLSSAAARGEFAGGFVGAEKSVHIEPSSDEPHWDIQNHENKDVAKRLKRVLLPKPFWYPPADDAFHSAEKARAAHVAEREQSQRIAEGDRELMALEALDHILEECGSTKGGLFLKTMEPIKPPACRRQLIATWRPPLRYAAFENEMRSGDSNSIEIPDSELAAVDSERRKKMRKKRKKKKAAAA